jgi:hypothetical protein
VDLGHDRLARQAAGVRFPFAWGGRPFAITGVGAVDDLADRPVDDVLTGASGIALGGVEVDADLARGLDRAGCPFREGGPARDLESS